MSFKSMIQDMRGEFGSISSKGFGLRLRSQWVVDDSSVETIDDSNQSCWANMPPELLTEVLMRIETSESTWPSRKDVVSCADVCRSWRKNMKEIVKSPQVSDKLTFPISLKQRLEAEHKKARGEMEQKTSRDVSATIEGYVENHAKL